ncbi:MAG: hypothetical protein IJ668_04430 [Selenomonadaceae bacterium]|nr:hypothetical protein [Selenomonadaceae bacterium]MBR1579725.1 hypothetical protein [Selenomonadaceae bacterium]
MPTNPKKAFVFFNCDENKSEQSMNIFYNRAVYRDLTTTRRLLWKKIRDELDSGRIFIEEDDIPTVRKMVLEDDPTDAGSLIKFGAIKAVDCY